VFDFEAGAAAIAAESFAHLEREAALLKVDNRF